MTIFVSRILAGALFGSTPVTIIIIYIEGQWEL